MDERSGLLLESTSEGLSVSVNGQPSTVPKELSKKDAECTKWRLVFLYHYSFICLGLMKAAWGPFLPQLQSQTHSTLASISIILPLFGLGYSVGSTVNGAAFDKYPLRRHSFFALFLALSALFVLCIGLCDTLPPLCGVILLIGVCASGIDCFGNTLMLATFRNDDSNAATDCELHVRLMHFWYALGATLCPLFVEASIALFGSYQYSLVAIALVCMPPAIALFAQRGVDARNVTRNNNNGNDDNDNDHLDDGKVVVDRYSSSSRWFLVVATSFLLVFYTGIELGFSSFVTTFVANFYQTAGASTGRLMNALFWATFGIGRLLAALCSSFSPRVSLLLACNFTGCVLASALMSALDARIDAMFVATAILGLSASSSFPNVFLFLEHSSVPVTGVFAALLIFGSAVGAMVLPYAIGLLLATWSMSLLPLLILVLSCTVLALYILIFAMSRLLREF